VEKQSNDGARNVLWPSLTSLDISGLPFADAQVFEAIKEAAPLLTSFSFRETPNTTDDDLAVLSTCPQSMSVLRLGGTLSPPAINSLCAHFGNSLTEVSLKNIENIDFHAAFSLAISIPSLEVFEFPNGLVQLWSGGYESQITISPSGFKHHIRVLSTKEGASAYDYHVTNFGIFSGAGFSGNISHMHITASNSLTLAKIQRKFNQTLELQWLVPKGTPLITSMQVQAGLLVAAQPHGVLTQTVRNHLLTRITVPPRRNLTLLAIAAYTLLYHK